MKNMTFTTMTKSGLDTFAVHKILLKNDDEDCGCIAYVRIKPTIESDILDDCILEAFQSLYQQSQRESFIFTSHNIELSDVKTKCAICLNNGEIVGDVEIKILVNFDINNWTAEHSSVFHIPVKIYTPTKALITEHVECYSETIADKLQDLINALNGSYLMYDEFIEHAN